MYDGELPCGALPLVCEVCRDSTWAQHIQTFLRIAIVPITPCTCHLETCTVGDLHSWTLCSTFFLEPLCSTSQQMYCKCQ